MGGPKTGRNGEAMRGEAEEHQGQDLPAGLTPDETLARICGLAAGQTVEVVWRDLVRALGARGVERVNYGLTRYRTGIGIGDPRDVLFLSTHALEKVLAFHTSGLYLRSADYRWVRENVGACSWGWVRHERAAGRLTAEECAAMDALGTARRRAGYTISFPEGQPRAKAAMALGFGAGLAQQAVDRHWRRHEAALMAICQMAHARIGQLPAPLARPRLTPRQREMLTWIADGKTIRDVATITGLSVGTIEKHLRLARAALDVETTPQAVAKLSFLNQLFVGQGLPG